REGIGAAAITRGPQGGSPMQYKPKNIAALHVALGGLPDAMHVEADRDIGLSATTVGELRKVTTWPANLLIATPPNPGAASAIRVSKARPATRLTPKS